jgi:hypothetical protein
MISTLPPNATKSKTPTGARLIDLPLERNEMFVGITRDWIALLEGRENYKPTAATH